jgi:predicted DNA-binding helix-hairpin-helix protein
MDPKASWALRNLHLYPVEVNTADYEMLIRVPGIGVTSAKKILQARKYRKLTHELLSQMGISLKRAIYFITCNGKYTGGKTLEQPILRYKLSDTMNQIKL